MAQAANQPAVVLQGLMRLDNIDGLRTEADLAKDKLDTPTLTPMFSLPPGTRVDITVRSESRVIDVTPHKGDVDT